MWVELRPRVLCGLVIWLILFIVGIAKMAWEEGVKNGDTQGYVRGYVDATYREGERR